MPASSSWEAFENALTLAGVGVWTWDAPSGDMRWSPFLYELLGKEQRVDSPSLDQLVESLSPDEDQERIRRIIQDAWAQDTATELECRSVPDTAADDRWLHMKVLPKTADEPPIERVVGIVRDITPRKCAQTVREENRRRLDFVLEVSSLALLITTPEGTLHDVSPDFEKKFGVPETDIKDTHVQDLDFWATPNERARILERLDEGRPVSAFETRLRTVSGEVREVELSVEDIQHRGKTALLWAIRDVTERNRLQRQLRGRAFFDSITGLPTRDLLIDRANNAIERADRSEQPLTLLYLDIDDFKAINEELGHSAGDELLASVAKRLKRSVRSSDTVARPNPASDTVARIAGDEFALLLEGSGEHGAMVVAKRLQKLFKTPFEVAGTTVHLSVSFGLAVREPADEDLTDGQELLRIGETAIYAARQHHKQIHVIGSEDEQHAGRLRRREELQRALRWNEFTVYYQPIVDLSDGSVSAAEALVRWQHPEKGLVTPSEFIPFAEESGLIEKLDRWVLKRAVRQVAVWRHDGRGPSQISVNMTARKHSSDDAQQYILQLLNEHGVPAEALTLETTERIAFHHGSPFDELRHAGVQLAIDDFGTGYSALFYLHRFDAHALKIDRGFIKDLDTDEQTNILVRAILDLASHLEMASIAEGVETDAQLDRLLNYGCRYAQGYLFARPMTAEAFESFYQVDVPLSVA